MSPHHARPRVRFLIPDGPGIPEAKTATNPLDNPLIAASVKPNTLRLYGAELDAFRDWLRTRRRPDLTMVSVDSDRLAELDKAMSDYFAWAYWRGGLPWIGGRLLSAVSAFVPGAAGKAKNVFPISKRAIRGWEQLCPSGQRPPIPFPVAAAIALMMMRSGHARWGAAVVVMFDSLIRIGEARNLRPDDIQTTAIFGADAVHRVTMRLPKTKTGLNQAAWLEMPPVMSVLQFWKLRPAPDGTVFGIKDAFYDLWHAMLARLELDTVGFTPHCLRHGGATHMAMCGKSGAEIQRRGRWRMPSSVVRYEQQAEAAFIASNIPDRVLKFGGRCAKALHLLKKLPAAESS
jgi:integrase